MNLFGMQKNKNPLAMLLMQQQQEAGPSLEQLGADPNSAAVQGIPPKQPNIGQQFGQQMGGGPQDVLKRVIEQQQAQPQAPQGNSMKEFMTTPLWGDKSLLMNKGEQGRLYDWMNKKQWFLPPKTGYVEGTGDVPTKLPATMVPEKPMWNPPGAAQQQTQSDDPQLPASGQQDPPTKDEQQDSMNLMTGEGLFQKAMSATTEMVQKYGKMAQGIEGAKVALKHEFQDTPELDEIIARTEAELANTKANRKQPGLGEFLVMALMNLSGMNPRQSADLVLGLGDQKQDEMRLEDRLAQLEGSRAGAKMQGRQAMRGMESQQRYQQLQNQMRQQEMSRKQFNEDREFGLKKQGQDSSLLRALAGQEAQVIQGSTNADAVKAASNSRAKLKKLLGLDDAGLDNLMRQQQQQQRPPDERQSRMFGELMAGGGYA